jgi:mannose-6-phosphate isomerase-like protein (cupin superfamily)
MQIVERANAPHYVWGEVCSGWRLAQGEALSVIEEEMPPGASEREHHHERARQFFYVLAGTLSMTMGDRVLQIPARGGLEIAPGVRHRAFNGSASRVEFLVISSPTTKADRVERAAP